MKSALHKMASTRFTIVLLIVLAIAVYVTHERSTMPVWSVVTPLALLGFNLAAALLTHTRLRQGGLLILHVGLLAVLFLAAVGRLTHFDGRVEITEGNTFNATDVEVLGRGAWHNNRLADIRFVQGPFLVDYAPGLKRGHTSSLVQMTGKGRTFQSALVGDDQPLILSGYRFYTTHNKGFAPVITWLPNQGTPTTGAIHMPSYPLFDWKQDNRWTPPGGAEIRFWLHLDVPRSDDAAWTLDSRTTRAVLVIHAQGQRITLKPGESARLTEGVLRFEKLATWMGYKIFFDPTLPWLLAAALLSVVGLAWYAWRKMFTRTVETVAPGFVNDTAAQGGTT